MEFRLASEKEFSIENVIKILYVHKTSRCGWDILKSFEVSIINEISSYIRMNQRQNGHSRLKIQKHFFKIDICGIIHLTISNNVFFINNSLDPTVIESKELLLKKHIIIYIGIFEKVIP